LRGVSLALREGASGPLVRVLDRQQALRGAHLVVEQELPEVAESGEDEG